MDFIFPRLIIKLWNEVLDVELCSSDKFVVRGDNNADDFTLKLKNLKNFLIVERQENDILITSYGHCCGIIYQLEGELGGLFQEFRKCYNIIKSKQEHQEENDYYLSILCHQCMSTLPSLTLDVGTFEQIYQELEKQHECETCKEKSSSMERIKNVSDLLRIYFLLKNFGRATSRQLLKRVATYLGDFTNFPRNNIISFHYNQSLWKNFTFYDLEFHHKLNNLSANQSLFQCCVQPSSEEGSEKVMVSKFLHCKFTSYSPDVKKDRFAELFRTFAEQIMETEICEEVADVSQLILKKVETNEDVNAVAIQVLEFLDADCERIQINYKERFKKIISSIQQENERESMLISQFITQFEQIKSACKGMDGESLFAFLSTSVANMKEKIGTAQEATITTETGDSDLDTFNDNWDAYLTETPSLLATFSSAVERLENLINADFFVLFQEEFDALFNSLEKTEELYVLTKLIEMVNTVVTKISRANEIEVMESIRSKQNLLQPTNGPMFLEVPLHSFDCVIKEDTDMANRCGIEQDTSGLVELSNIFDGPVTVEPFAIMVFPWESMKEHTYGQVLKHRLLLFLQHCYEVRELNASQIVHRNLTLENTLYLKRWKWACNFGIWLFHQMPQQGNDSFQGRTQRSMRSVRPTTGTGQPVFFDQNG